MRLSSYLLDFFSLSYTYLNSLLYQKCVQQSGCSRVLARICVTGIRNSDEHSRAPTLLNTPLVICVNPQIVLVHVSTVNSQNTVLEFQLRKKIGICTEQISLFNIYESVN